MFYFVVFFYCITDSIIFIFYLQLTTQFLVFAAESVFLFADLVKLVSDTLDLSLLDAEIALRLLVQLDGLLKTRLDFDVDALELLCPLLELPGRSVGFFKIDDENLNL